MERKVQLKRKIEHLNRVFKIYSAYTCRKIRGVPLPMRLWIELTNVCNLNCKMCLNKSIPKNKRGFMDFNLFKKVIDEASNFVYDVYLHHRGESLLHPDIFKMIEYAKMKNIFTRLHTNATLLTEEKSYLLLNSGLDFLSFSFDGYEKETYEKIRVGANFERTLGNINNFLRIKKKLNKKTPYAVFTVIEFTESKTKNDNKKKFISQFNSLPLDKFIIRKPHNWGGDYNVKEEKANFSKENNYLPCTFPWYSLTIFYDGDVLPCPQDFFGKNRLGNMKDTSLSEIWDSTNLISLRKKMVMKQCQSMEPCNKCDRLWRKKILGVPREEVFRFLKDSIFGYKSIRRFFS